MPDSDYDRYEQALALAVKFERLRDPFNALEWASMALYRLPGDAVALRHKEKALAEIQRLRSGPDTGSHPTLPLSEQEEFEKHLLLAESFLSNGAGNLAIRELKKARLIAPGHVMLTRLENMAGIGPDNTSRSENPDVSASEADCYGSCDPRSRENDTTVLIRRIAVARSLAKNGLSEKALAIANELLTAYGPLPQITGLIEKLSDNDL